MSTRSRRKPQARARRSVATLADPALRLIPEYRGQPVIQQVIQATGGPLSTTVTTGAIANIVTLSAANISNFASRFVTFEQFRIVKVRARVRNFSVQNPGILNMWYDSQQSSTPTATLATNAISKKFNASSVEKEHTLVYTPHDPAEQAWSLVSAASGPIGYFKLYTDNSTYGSSIVATPYCLVEFDFTIQFRNFV